MNSYLLSNGELTTDLVEYAIDYIKVYLILKYNDTPYSSFGNSMDLSVNMRSEVIYQVKVAINTAVARLNSKYPKLNAVLSSINYNELNQLIVTLSMENEEVKLALGNEN